MLPAVVEASDAFAVGAMEGAIAARHRCWSQAPRCFFVSVPHKF